MNTNAIPVTFSGCKSEKIAQIVCAFRNFAYFCCALHSKGDAEEDAQAKTTTYNPELLTIPADYYGEYGRYYGD